MLIVNFHRFQFAAIVVAFFAALIPQGLFGQIKKPSATTQQLGIIPHELKAALRQGQKALDEQRYTDAFEHLAPILDDSTPDYFLSPSGPSLKSALFERISSLDSSALEIWEQIHASDASTQLASALSHQDVFSLDQVSQRFKGTTFANKANIIAARLLMEQGKYHAAAFRLQESLNCVRSEISSQDLTIMLADCLLRTNRADQARKVLADLHDRVHLDVVNIAGTDVSWFQSIDEIDEWMRAHLWQPSSTESYPQASMPQFEIVWQFEVGERQEEDRLLSQLSDQFINSHLPSRPVLAPRSSQETIIYRNAWKLFGVSPSGRRFWAYPHETPFEVEDSLAVQNGIERQLTETGRTIQRRTWGDQLYANFSCDHERIYLLDELGFQYDSTLRHLNNPLHLQTTNQRRNRLVALSLRREGAVEWILGDENHEPSEFGAAMFLSAPFVHRDRIYVLADRGENEASGVISLVCLDAKSAEVIWDQPLHDKPTNYNMVQRLNGGQLTLADNMLICWTPQDYLFGIDISIGRLTWMRHLTTNSRINLFPKTGSSARISSSKRFALLEDELTPSDRWFDRGLLTDGSFCIITPRITDSIICFDIYSGETVWSRPRRDFVYAGCIHRGSVLLVGRERLAMIQLRDGNSAWAGKYYVQLESFGVPNGRGTRHADFFSLSTSDGDFMTINLLDGTTKQQTFPSLLGNLVSHNEYLISQSATHLIALAATTQLAQVETDNTEKKQFDDVAAKHLVEQLGADKFVDREAAQQKLLSLGESAMQEIQIGSASADIEVRTRCRKVLEILGKDVLTNRIARFLSKPDDSNDLPGWRLFNDSFGDSDATRRVFAEMFKSESKLFLLEADHDKLAGLVAQRCRTLQQAVSTQQYQIPFSTLASMLFFSTHQLQDKAAIQRNIVTFCLSPTASRSVTADDSELFKRMLAKLLAQSSKSSDYSLATLAKKYGLAEGYPIAVNILHSGANGYTKVVALDLVDQHGGKKDTRLLVGLLEDSSTVRSNSHNRTRYELQVRDVAMIQLLKLHDLDPANFEFDQYNERKKMASNYQLGFVNNEKRIAAYDKCKKAIAEKGTNIDEAKTQKDNE